MFHTNVLLYAEDDSAYAELLGTTLACGGFPHRLIRVPDGEQAISYLKGEGKYSDRVEYPLPGVVLLDLKMPRCNGFDVLQWVRQKSIIPHIPVVVLTSSEEIRDINRAYQLGANSFLVKPPNVKDLKAMLKMLESYWFQLNVSAKGTASDLVPANPFVGVNAFE